MKSVVIQQPDVLVICNATAQHEQTAITRLQNIRG